jgi:hypothetical protein
MIRHPLRGLFGGLLFGVGLALILVQLGSAPLGTYTFLVIVVLFAVLGTVAAYVLPARPALRR